MKTTLLGGLFLVLSAGYYDRVQITEQGQKEAEEQKTEVQIDYTEQDKQAEAVRRAIRRKLENLA